MCTARSILSDPPPLVEVIPEASALLAGPVASSAVRDISPPVSSSSRHEPGVGRGDGEGVVLMV